MAHQSYKLGALDQPDAYVCGESIHVVYDNILETHTPVYCSDELEFCTFALLLPLFKARPIP